MKLKVPLQPSDVEFTSWPQSFCGRDRLEKMASWNPLIIHDATVREKADNFMGRFDKEHLTTYMNHEDKEMFFPTVDRMHIVYQILQNTRFAQDPHCLGLKSIV